MRFRYLQSAHGSIREGVIIEKEKLGFRKRKRVRVRERWKARARRREKTRLSGACAGVGRENTKMCVRTVS